MTLEQAAEIGCRACASPGGGCQFLGTAATAQVVGEALGMSLGHSALAPSGQPIWRDNDGVYRLTGTARVFVTEAAAIAAIKTDRIAAGDVLVLMCRGPLGAGMEETSQLTSALRYLPFGKHVALVTDARFSGFSTGACIGHVSPEALAGGPIGKLRDGDVIEIIIDTHRLDGSVNLVGENGVAVGVEAGSRILQNRAPRPDLAADPALPDDTRIWAMLQSVSGGTWGGAVFDADAIARVMTAGTRALAEEK